MLDFVSKLEATSLSREHTLGVSSQGIKYDYMKQWCDEHFFPTHYTFLPNA